ENAVAAVLIKPQFEAGKRDVGKGGIVKDKKVHMRVLSDIDSFAAGMGLFPEKYTFSPVKGGSGNIEYLVLLRKARGKYFIRDFKELVESSFDKL
ncbi:MAG: TlyA family RNA methyltransferase, partial [Ruminococcus flavefaciens]|nr:TlyA family RNA methyltransferase [Ruminococcus flavefaciens]